METDINRRDFLGAAAVGGAGWLLQEKKAAQPGEVAGKLTPPATGRVRVAFLISNGSNVIDMAGPWEVFQDVQLAENHPNTASPFELRTVAEKAEPVRATGGLQLIPDYSVENAPVPHVVVVPADSRPGSTWPFELWSVTSGATRHEQPPSTWSTRASSGDRQSVRRRVEMKTQLMAAIAALTLLAATPIVGQAPAAPAPTIPIEGLDAVMLVQGKEVQGKESIGVLRGNFKYIFAWEENKAAFEKDPERYAVQLNGICARMGGGVRGNPDMWTVHEGKIYLFASDTCQKAFTANPAKFFEPKREPLAVTPEAAARAKSLLAQAVEAMGGAAKVDGLSSVQFSGTWAGPNGDGDFPQTITSVYPDRLRFEQSSTVNGRSGTLAFVVSPADSFVVVSQGGRTQTFGMVPATKAEREKEFKRHPLGVIRARNAQGFVAIASGSGKVGDRAIEYVTAEFDGIRMTLAIDPATGQVMRLSYFDRGPDGFGTFDESYSDFRTVEGVTLPLVTTATQDGQPFPRRTFQAQSLLVNTAISADLFQRPPPPPHQP